MKYLVCFGDSSLKLSRWILILEAKLMNVYDQILFYDETALDKDFVNRHQSFIDSNPRGYGYWIWKPQILVQVLDIINYGDSINYIDIGCKLNILGRRRLLDYFNILDNSKGILAFQYGSFHGFTEDKYTKADLFYFFGLDYNSNESKTHQFLSGAIFIKKNDFSVKLVKEWSRISKITKLIDDSPSLHTNSSDFIEHRHDQSIFSLLCKINNVASLSAIEIEPLKFNVEYKYRTLYKYPIVATRRKQKSILPFLKKNIFELIKQLISLFLKK